MDVEASVGFDVYSIVRSGTTQRVRAFASLSQMGNVRFYRINLVTGNARLLGDLRPTVVDIALPLNQL